MTFRKFIMAGTRVMQHFNPVIQLHQNITQTFPKWNSIHEGSSCDATTTLACKVRKVFGTRQVILFLISVLPATFHISFIPIFCSNSRISYCSVLSDMEERLVGDVDDRNYLFRKVALLLSAYQRHVLFVSCFSLPRPHLSTKRTLVRFQSLTAANMKMTLLWDFGV
jgi:hypothetical protein